MALSFTWCKQKIPAFKKIETSHIPLTKNEGCQKCTVLKCYFAFNHEQLQRISPRPHIFMGSNSFASDFSYPIMLHTISGNRSSTHSSLQQENNIMKDEIVLERYKFISLKSVSYLFLQKTKVCFISSMSIDDTQL